MAVPKRKISKSRKQSRRSHHAITNARLSRCENCGAMHMPHKVCPECGYYKKAPVTSPKGA
jgi:large subunit ribosomal protein L32